MTRVRKRLRILTWNIHGCLGADGHYDAKRIGLFLRELKPDVAAIQEVDTRGLAGQRAGIYDYLRDQLGGHGHHAWAISGEDGHYGQILASRLPLTERKVHDVSVPGREPRKAIEARVNLATGVLRVIGTHLGLSIAERRHQLARLREIVEEDQATPTILLGDFNDFLKWGRAHAVLSPVFGAWTNHLSFPSRFPMLPLDRMWLRPGTLLSKSWIAKEARSASDHLPLVAEVVLPDEPHA